MTASLANWQYNRRGYAGERSSLRRSAGAYADHVHRGEGRQLSGSASIGRVLFSKTRRRVYYRDEVLQRPLDGGFRANHYDLATGEGYWVSGPEQAGGDRPLR